MEGMRSHLLGCPTSVVRTLVLLSHPGPDVHGILQSATVLTACWRIFAFLVFIWRTVLAEKPQKYQVTIKQITEKINNLKNENRELAENISTWEQKPGILNTRPEDLMQRAVTTEECNLEEREGEVQDHCAASGSVKLGEEAKFQRLEPRIHFLKEIAGQLNRKLDMKRCELVEKKQLLAVEEKLKLAEEETQKYKRRLEECQRQMQEAEITWRHQIALAEKKAQDNWLRAQELERENAEMRREVAYLKQRLEAISRQRQAEKYMKQEAILGGPYGLHPPLTSQSV
ncbi:transport and Golgi organization protein 1 homolog isoform X2 [Vicugna pacos]|uniref:Transport and Golgi organization protein 1 homolog isoform X2 n=1 Tax=Vicugna pacos TaxID=30538 RepID=A0ABM5E7I1_VICPA